ncbi:substrate-binding periplasmic protein [Iodobacter arcticus]|uniref:Substrate-binding periplasmic protein n=1 Tax=Iodobacter arcticus TaxID=590593 RepID=A0ABW2QXB5_9NEIS
MYARRCSLLFSLFLACPADGVQLVGAEVPPFATSGAGGGSGLAVEILQEAAKRLNESTAVSVMPFARAMAVTMQGSDILVTPLGRVASREDKYQWVAPLMDEVFVLISHKKHQARPLSREQAERLVIGVMRNSVGEGLATAFISATIDGVPMEATNAKKLAAGRIGAWVASWNTALYAQREAGLAAEDLVRGEVLMRTTLYVAASLKMPQQDVLRWRKVLEKMRKDGSIEALEKKYRYEAP